MIVYILLAVFVALQVIDAVSTVRVLNKGGKELNPLMRFLMGKVGKVPALIGTKVCIIGTMVGVVVACPVSTSNVLLAILDALYLLILLKYNLRS